MKKSFLSFGIACSLLTVQPGQAQQLIYNFYDSSRKDYDLMVSNLDGTGKRNITRHNSVDWTYYAYGDTLYFISDRDTCNRCFFLYRSRPDGSGLQKVSNLMLEDSWMSSRNRGTEMVVSARTANTRFQLYLLNLANGSYRQITHDTAAYYNDPVFVQEGSKIAYRYRSQRRNRNQITEIWIMDADGSNRRQLTQYPDSLAAKPVAGYHAGAPKWNAAGGFISYQSMRNGKYHIYAVSPDGKKHWQVTNTSLNEGWHDWSTDGRWLLFDCFNDAQDSFDIVLMNMETGEQRWITKGEWKGEYAPIFINN